jgi:hypothetical protein
MSAAILQGVPATTLDTDIWVDLAERRYPAVLDVVRRQGGTILARTVVVLAEDTLVNFLYRVDGLRSFDDEYRSAKTVRLGRWKIAVLPLDRIIASKKFVGREKGLAHLPLLERVAALRRRRR